MNHATRTAFPLRRAGKVLIHLTHGSLLFAGLFAGSTILGGVLPSLSAVDPVATAAARNTTQEVAGSIAVAEHVPAVEVEKVQVPPAVEPTGLTREMVRVRDWISRTYRVSGLVLEPVLLAAQDAGKHSGIDPLLIVAVMAVESRFNPFAESEAGAQGLMQVIPRYHMDKIGKSRGEDALFDPKLNVRVGTLILREGLRRYGSIQGALQYYSGAISDPEAEYARKVMAVKQRLLSAAGRVGEADV
ncbi:putative transglycosylase [Azoarcus olearius]|uniref:lytic transglycosylase domain-containing protein n=1 Tax=Azoarcus sp. (strain BH72) TaxID=418699 RepID=UPI0008061A1D|nr:transglycosylase SLT domain-containing protein [Azoarcus olearius]ANQ86507.1 putative transglycosylase [Azoarcus olearius]